MRRLLQSGALHKAPGRRSLVTTPPPILAGSLRCRAPLGGLRRRYARGAQGCGGHLHSECARRVLMEDAAA